MYLNYFGLERQPFKITPDTSLFFEGNNRGAALEALAYAISTGEGITKVVGEVGSGKTMLCRMLELRLTDQVDIVYIANPSLSPDNILHLIAFELGLTMSRNASKLDVMQALQSYLLQKHAVNKQVVVLVEEAQSMPLETLEEIRLLSNLETDQDKLLQIVLFGQPELDTNLASPEIRQLRERITHSFVLEPFSPGDTRAYLNFRMRAVGYRGPDVFNQKTARNIEKLSSGLTRRINILADKALLAAFSEDKHNIEPRHIHIAANDSEFGSKNTLRPYTAGFGVAATVAASVWIGTMIPSMMHDSAPGGPLANLSLKSVKESSIANVDMDDEVMRRIRTIQPAAGGRINRTSTQSSISPDDLSLSEAVSLTDERLGHTARWLHEASDNHYSIQLFMTTGDYANELERFLQKAHVMLDFEKIYVYETIIRGERMYSVLYNDYHSRKDARIGLESLPESLRSSRPYLRKVGSVRSELIKQKMVGLG